MLPLSLFFFTATPPPFYEFRVPSISPHPSCYFLPPIPSQAPFPWRPKYPPYPPLHPSPPYVPLGHRGPARTHDLLILLAATSLPHNTNMHCIPRLTHTTGQRSPHNIFQSTTHASRTIWAQCILKCTIAFRNAQWQWHIWHSAMDNATMHSRKLGLLSAERRDMSFDLAWNMFDPDLMVTEIPAREFVQENTLYYLFYRDSGHYHKSR